jgi:hypothetical protein
VHRAAPPAPPTPSRALQRARAEHATYLAQRMALQHKSMVRALLLLAVGVLLASFARAGFSTVFLPGWWRHW